MTPADAHNPTPLLPNPLEPAATVVKEFKKLSLWQQIAVLTTAISAGLLTGIIFIVCADGFIVTLGQSLALPRWLVLTLAVPATLAGIFFGARMMLSTYRYEQRAARGETGDGDSTEK